LVVDALMFALVFSFAVQVCVFSVASKQSFVGVVYGADGPVAGAIVSALGTNGKGSAVTDGAGHYSISEGLPSGTYNVSTFALGYLVAETDNVQVTVGQTTQTPSFDLQLSGGVSGRVTDAVYGTPLSGITVVASSVSGAFACSALTDSSGDYRLATDLPTGSYNITVFFPEGYISQSSTQSVTAGFEVKNVDFRLPRSGIISGKITAPDGTPLDGVTVDALSGSNFGVATTNTTGDYSIASGLNTGIYTVIAASSGGGYNTSSADVTAGQETSGVNIVLTVTPPAPSGIITGQVIDRSSQSRIANATVTAIGPAGSHGSAETDNNGNYEISSGLITTGSYNVTASMLGYQDQMAVGIYVTVKQTTTNVNLPMGKIPASQSGTITGSVTGAPNPIPEFQYPLMTMLSMTLVAAVAGRLLLKTKRLQNACNYE
jgi:hypothetical protein